jgi:NAD(P)-dependent dehydrogenase (short-subunit alcohol dehydrogenase family)
MSIAEKFKLDGKVAVITGGGGLLGKKHAEAIIEGGGLAVLVDISQNALDNAFSELRSKYGEDVKLDGFVVDISKSTDVELVKTSLMEKYGSIDILINNAANNPKVESNSKNLCRFENFPLDMWYDDIAVGLTGALLCSQIFGSVMAQQGKGVILNISSDLGIIAPDQRLYHKAGLTEEEQSVKPVTYSVIKHGLIGLTKYLATYWADKGVRANTLCPAGVFNQQNDEFVKKLEKLIPMGRMADVDEYTGTVLYLVSDASSYMTGSTIIVDGGRTVW